MSAPVYKRSRHGLLPVEWNYNNQFHYSGFESSNLGSIVTYGGGSKGQITTHLADKWTSAQGHGQTAYLAGTDIEILMIVFGWQGINASAPPSFSLAIRGHHNKDFIEKVELPSVRYSSHVHQTPYGPANQPAPGIILYTRDIIDKYYAADANGYHWYDSSTQKGYKRIAPMTYNDTYYSGNIRQNFGPDYEYTTWKWNIRQEGSADATLGRRKENGLLNYLGNNTSDFAQLKPSESKQKSAPATVGYTINKTGWLSPSPAGVPVGIYFNHKGLDEFNNPTWGTKLQLRNWITARLGHTDWVLIDAQRCETAGGEWYTDVGLGAFPFPSNDSRTDTYMTNFFGYGIQNCRDVSSDYDTKASMLRAVKVTLNNESNREVIIPIENYYDNSVTVSSYDGISH